MNDSTEKLLAKLSQATSSEPTEPMDDETALLRESWLAFGKLVEAADAESKPVMPRPRATQHASLTVRFIVALAASLLVAFAAWAIVNRGLDNVEPLLPIAEINELPASVPRIADVAEASENADQVEAPDEFAWEDSFDEQLATASQAIRSVQSDWSGGDRRYSVLADQFEQFSDELSEGSL
jgi:hypothetical protein